MANFSFSSAGAVSNPLSRGTLNVGNASGSILLPSTPAAKALSNAASPNSLGQSRPNIPLANPTPNLNGQSRPNIATAPKTPGLLEQQPTTPLKKQTTTDTAGNTTTNEYHAPVEQATPEKTAANAPQQNPNTNFQTNTSSAPQGTPVQPTPPTPTLSGLLGGATMGAGNALTIGQQQEQEAFQKAQELQKTLADSRINESNALKTNYLNPIPIGDQEGRARTIRDQYLQQQTALSQELSGEATLAGTGAGLLGTGIGGYNTAASTAAPSTAQYGQTVFNPLTGQYSGGSSGVAPTDPFYQTLQQYAQMAANGQIANVPSTITGNAVLNAQLQQMAKTINPNYSPITSSAQGASAADLTGQASAIQAQANGAEQNFNLMLDIAKKGGVNDANVPILNTLQQNVNRGLTSSAAVANFQSLIQSVRSQYASILGGGTVTVEALQEAQSLIPNDISLSALQSLGQNLKYDAANRVQGLNQQIQALGGGANASGNTSSPSNGGKVVQTSAGPINVDW